MSRSFENLNQVRNPEYQKDISQEKFLEKFNNTLQDFEQSQYDYEEIGDPIIFTFGPPRSGTTLITQLIAHCLDIGYINNFIARFWKAPVTGIRLSNLFFDSGSFSAFQSDYGSTEHLLDVHEFGYFWRSLLQKHTFESIKNAKDRESELEWDKIKDILVNIQRTFGKPTLFKNILGSYHLPKFKKLLKQVLYVYIERDPLDTAISILNARNKYYSDSNQWWSYVPPEYEKVINEDYWTQIAGQVYYLKKFYRNELDKIDSDHVVHIHYKDLCSEPDKILDEVQRKCSNIGNSNLKQVQPPPSSFEYRSHRDHKQLKKKFETAFKRIEQDDPAN